MSGDRIKEVQFKIQAAKKQFEDALKEYVDLINDNIKKVLPNGWTIGLVQYLTRDDKLKILLRYGGMNFVFIEYWSFGTSLGTTNALQDFNSEFYNKHFPGGYAAAHKLSADVIDVVRQIDKVIHI